MRGDRAVTTPLATALLLGLVLATGVAAYFLVVKTSMPDAPPPAAMLRAEACGTSGRWTIARLFVSAGTVHVPTIAAQDGRTGAGLVLQGLDPVATAGEQLWVVTPAGQSGALDCAGSVRLVDAGRNALVAAVPARAGTTHPVAFEGVSCVSDDHGTSATITLARVAPGLKARDVQAFDDATGYSTLTGGKLRYSASVSGATALSQDDVLTIRTQRNKPEQLSCGDDLRLVDKVSGATLRIATLPSG